MEQLCRLLPRLNNTMGTPRLGVERGSYSVGAYLQPPPTPWKTRGTFSGLSEAHAPRWAMRRRTFDWACA
jgi:hypothetical protein